MARLIPPLLDENSAPGERSVFQALGESTATDSWVVLHSLEIAKHVSKPQSETDFVVLAPGLGILVIEVKSHQSVHVQDGVWTLGRQAPTRKSPFVQANEAKFSIQKELRDKHKIDLTAVPLLHAVWFTGVRARTELTPNNEWAEWQVLDSQDLERDPIAAIRRTYAAGTAHLMETVKSLARGGIDFDERAVDRIARALRPNFEVRVVPGDRKAARERQLVRFLEEQVRALDQMSANKRVIFTGPAGSGKTFLALEAARREIERGRTGRLVCYNKFLAQRLQVHISEPGLTVGTFHSQMLEIAGLRPPSEPTTSFWNKELPEKALEALLDVEEVPDDFLIIDEVQDLLSEPFFDVFELLVKDGLAQGRVLMFGDFENQTLYDDGHGSELLKERVPHITSFHLSINCRNLPRIGYLASDFLSDESIYADFRRDDDGMNPVPRKYTLGVDQTPFLRQAIKSLQEEHFGLNDIVVLSPLAENSTAATTTDTWLRGILVPADGRPAPKGKVRFCSIHAFKGLDAPAVILTDLDRSSIPNFDSLLYVGLSRATDRLHYFYEGKFGLSRKEGAR